MLPHRTYCDTLQEMREVLKRVGHFNIKRSTSILSVLIEECQTYGNRMEAGLNYGHDLNQLHARRKELRAEVDELLPKKAAVTTYTVQDIPL